MAKIEMKGLDEYRKKFDYVVAELHEGLLGRAIYTGADLMMDSIREEITAIPLRDEKAWGSPEHPVAGLRKVEKKGLHDGLGIAGMRSEDGFLNVKIGFDGYNEATSWANWSYKFYSTDDAKDAGKDARGRPNAMIARSIERGTSWLEPCPFMKKAVARTREKVVERMSKELDEELKKLLN